MKNTLFKAALPFTASERVSHRRSLFKSNFKSLPLNLKRRDSLLLAGRDTKQRLKDPVDYASLFASCFFFFHVIESYLASRAERIVGPARVASVHSLVLAASNAHTLPVKWFPFRAGSVIHVHAGNGENDRWRTRHGMKYRHRAESICSQEWKRTVALFRGSVLMPARETLSLRIVCWITRPNECCLVVLITQLPSIFFLAGSLWKKKRRKLFRWNLFNRIFDRELFLAKKCIKWVGMVFQFAHSQT